MRICSASSWWVEACATAPPAFPGRARRIGPWPGSDGWTSLAEADAIWAAAALAHCEAGRGGWVLTALSDPDPPCWAALSATAAAGPLALCAPADLAEGLRSSGWRLAEGPFHPPARATAWLVEGRLERCPKEPAPEPQRQPVLLPSLGSGCLPPWPRSIEAGPLQTCIDALGWLSAREPLLRVAASASIAASAALALEGRRSVHCLPAGARIDPDLLAACRTVSAGVKIVLAVDDLPRPLPPGWWVAAPADAEEVSACLAYLLGDEEPWILALPDATTSVPPWPGGAWEPGRCRCLREGDGGTVVCSPRGVDEALAQSDGRMVVLCSSLAPFPSLRNLPRPLSAPDCDRWLLELATISS